ncbi:molybdopterin cofactor-binding domain-containing protein [Maritimibacter sp. DP1N21-5]|uniref:xanthine dehydrogenase family protein molybdopterin-binding subunit n=1 Tax=Maritimibacter sp. DP1N21-5 TaxID=2836867 RepID=UPI001C46C3EA|nr:molybdopterin cofactor-binding domain-containing protein [Maritimibacter sp. DP1N21-5]MBV7409408.1 molybdopterin-dependent oxidoreductase [Maritimibacter sp. DP1N21-5]
MSKLGTFTRRAFIVGSVAVAGGVAFGAYKVTQAPGNPLEPAEGAALNRFVVIDQSGVTVIVPRAEMGQGVQTTLAALVAEELAVPMSMLKVEHGPPSKDYGNPAFLLPRNFDSTPPNAVAKTVMEAVPRIFGMQITGGSTSMVGAAEEMRVAGASAREVLISAAAERLGVGRDQLRAENGAIVATDGTTLPYADLAEAAAHIDPPQNPPLKSPDEWTLLGTSQPRLDQPGKATGTAMFGIDKRVEGMKFATVRMSPRLGGEMLSYDADAAEGMPGVEKVIDLGNGIAVVATNTWLAMQAADAVEIEWGDAPYDATTEEIFADLEAAFDGDPNDVPEEAGEIAEADTDLTAEYRAPFLAHAAMEPMTAAAHFTGDHLTIWAGVQAPVITQKNAADLVGLSPEDVTVETTIMGGSFGRRGFNDFALQAARIAAAVPGTPISLAWSREEDMRHDHYRPGAIARMRGAVKDGRIDMLKADLSSGSVMRATMKAFMGIDRAMPDPMVTEGVALQPYLIPNKRIAGYVPERTPQVGFWRSVGASQNAFFMESFVDEMAHSAGADPFEFRLAHIEPLHAPSANVLKTVAEMSNWGRTPAGKGRGIAISYSFGTPVAQVIEVSDEDGAIRIDRVWIAADLGQIFDPGNVEAQLVGGCIYGLSAAIQGAITFEDGQVVEGNFYDYDALRMNTTPVFEVSLHASGGHIGGVGEPGVPPAAPALANAIFDLTGKRIRSLPLRNEVDFLT